jgi:Domain of unknown function (DUF4281)
MWYRSNGDVINDLHTASICTVHNTFSVPYTTGTRYHPSVVRLLSLNECDLVRATTSEIPLTTKVKMIELMPLIGSWTAQDLWTPIHLITMPSWILLAILPRWKYTPILTLVAPLINAAVYALSITALMMGNETGDQPDFSTLDGVVQLFQNPNGVFVGWVHYLVFDLLVGRAISMDAIDRGASNVVYAIAVVPCIFMTLYLGPVGFLMYSLVRTILTMLGSSSPDRLQTPENKDK